MPQDSTHFDRTQAILRKYDPAYIAAQDKERALAAQRKGSAARAAPPGPSASAVRLCQRLDRAQDVARAWQGFTVLGLGYDRGRERACVG